MNKKEIIVGGKRFFLRRGSGSDYTDETGDTFYFKHFDGPDSYGFYGLSMREEYENFLRIDAAGIRTPRVIAIDYEQGIMVKQFRYGPHAEDHIRRGYLDKKYVLEVIDFARAAEENGFCLDYSPSNFVIHGGKLYYTRFFIRKKCEKNLFKNAGALLWPGAGRILR